MLKYRRVEGGKGNHLVHVVDEMFVCNTTQLFISSFYWNPEVYHNWVALLRAAEQMQCLTSFIYPRTQNSSVHS